ncbi:MAG TPA: CopD family protein [Rhizomicrobium sp.]|jgi:putative copper resistance protein D|nr:CopD family protein [Rhizomicrobium sp.]
MTAFLVFVRGLHEASLMALFGSACLLRLLAAKVPELALESGHLILGRRLAALVALITAPLWMALVAAEMTGTPAAATDTQTLWQVAIGTLFGQVFLARMALVLGLVLAVWLGRLRTTIGIAGLCLILIAITSHTASASPGGFAAIGASSDALHLLTGGYWIGSLPVLATLLAERPAAPRLGLAISVFAEWGMLSVALLVMTGMINTTMVLLGMPGHDSPTYLAVLGAKLVLVLVMIGLALINHFRLRPRLAQGGAVERLKLHVGWELGLGLAVIALAMTLTASAPTLQ